MNSTPLNLQLKKIIHHYLQSHSSLTVNGLAKRANVPGSSLRRMLNGINKTEAAPHTILNIISYIYREKNITNLLEKLDGPIKERLSHSFGTYAQNEVAFKKEHILSEILSDQMNYIICKLAATHKGTKENEVLLLYGQIGLGRLKNLVQKDILFVDDKKNYHAHKKDFILNIKLSKPHLTTLVEFYRPSEVSLEKNLFCTLSESLTFIGIQKIKEIQKEALFKTEKILNNSEYHGEIPYFCLQLCEAMLPALHTHKNSKLQKKATAKHPHSSQY